MRFGLRETAFVVLLMAIPLAGWWLVFRPNSMRHRQMLRQIEVKQAKLKALNVATGTIGDLKKEIGALESGIQLFRSKLPNEKEIDKVLHDVWRLAEANQLATKSIRTIQREGKGLVLGGGAPAQQPIAMKLEGDFTGFYAFLLALENQPRITRITKMSVKKMDKAPEGHMQADFEMSIFFEPNTKDEPCPTKNST